MSFAVVRRSALWVAAAALIVAALIVVLSDTASPPHGAAVLPKVQVQILSRQRVSDWAEYSGRLEAAERVDVRPKVAGSLRSVHFQDGQQVAAGDLLFTLDAVPFEVELQRVQAALAQARDRQRHTANEYERGQRLVAASAIARRDVDALENAANEARSATLAAQASVMRARLDVGYTRIRAPISGRISRPEITVGNEVAAGAGATPLASIVTLAPLYASFNVDEQTYLRSFGDRADQIASEVQVGLDGEQGHPHPARLHSVDNQLDLRSGTIRMRAIVQQPDQRMIPGLQARVRLQASAPYQALLVDETLIGTDQDQRFVLVVAEDERVFSRRVELGARHGRQRIVRRGLDVGDRVIVDSPQRVRAGDKVQVVVAPAADLQEGTLR